MSGNWSGVYTDGSSARGWDVQVGLDSHGITIRRLGEGQDLVWPYEALRTDLPISTGARDALVKNAHHVGATLFVESEEFVRQLRQYAPSLTTAAHRWRWARPLIAVAVAAIVLVTAIWKMDLRPARTIAMALPETSRQKVGRSVVEQFAKQYKTCTEPTGRAALDKLLQRLLKSTSNPHYYRVTVVNWGLVNAFAAPGGQMLLTRGLIRSARSPEEVAGVLTHEIGHGVERHPEAGLVRALGLSALLDIFSGGSSGALTQVGATFLQTGYICQDERAADVQALRLLKNAGIAQRGLKDFFDRIAKKVDASKSSAKKTIGAFTLLRMHPFPEERAKMVEESKSYASTPALTPTEWRALRRICTVQSG